MKPKHVMEVTEGELVLILAALMTVVSDYEGVDSYEANVRASRRLAQRLELHRAKPKGAAEIERDACAAVARALGEEDVAVAILERGAP